MRDSCLAVPSFPINGSVGFVHLLLGFKAKNAAHASFRSDQRGRPLSRREEEEVVQPLRERYRAHTFSRPSLLHLGMSVRSWAVELSGVAASAWSVLLYTGRKVCRLCGDHLKEGVPSDSNRTAANLPNVP